MAISATCGQAGPSTLSNSTWVVNMFLEQPLTALRNVLETMLGLSLKDYDFYLQDTLKLDPSKNLVAQCLHGTGTVQVHLELKQPQSQRPRINILDIMKPVEEELTDLDRLRFQQQQQQSQIFAMGEVRSSRVDLSTSEASRQSEPGPTDDLLLSAQSSEPPIVDEAQIAAATLQFEYGSPQTRRAAAHAISCRADTAAICSDIDSRQQSNTELAGLLLMHCTAI